jgi:dTDP-4-amino-4,6-dideoxygalactose transaminase
MSLGNESGDNGSSNKLEEKITAKTKAVIPVHLYGQPADMDPIMNIAEIHNLFVVEDCAQAHFAEYKGNNVGTIGDDGTFSFYSGKNLGAYGDAGAIITNNEKLGEKCRMFANHGFLQKHEHKMEGTNSRLDGIQAAILSVKLKCIFKWNKKRHQNAQYYNQLLKNIDEVEVPEIRNNSNHVFHLYVIRAEERDKLKSYLRKGGISTGIHYPKPLPFTEAYDYLNYTNEEIPIADQYQNLILSLPMYPELTKEQIEFVAKKIKKFYSFN